MKPKKAGRPPLKGKGKAPHSIHLTDKHVATLRRLGSGNLSAGARLAAEYAENNFEIVKNTT